MIFYALLSQYYEQYQQTIDKTWQGVSAIAPKVSARVNNKG